MSTRLLKMVQAGRGLFVIAQKGGISSLREVVMNVSLRRVTWTHYFMGGQPDRTGRKFVTKKYGYYIGADEDYSVNEICYYVAICKAVLRSKNFFNLDFK